MYQSGESARYPVPTRLRILWAVVERFSQEGKNRVQTGKAVALVSVYKESD